MRTKTHVALDRFGRVFRPAPRGYSSIQVLLHWTIGILCIGQVPTAWAIARTHQAHAFLKPSQTDLFLHQVHAWAGWTILALVVWRLLIRIARRSEERIAAPPMMRHRLAAASHAMLYLLLIGLPVTGTLAMYITRSAAPLHSMLAWALLFLVVLHTAATAWHHLVWRDPILRKMIRPTRRLHDADDEKRRSL